MKTPEFWYQKPGLKSTALMALVPFWRLGGNLRKSFVKPYKSKIPVICIGNIVTGGSGKTPTALALCRLMKKKGHRPVFVTRGYGGREAGPLRVNLARHTAADVGDEALLLARVAPVWIGRDRAAAIREAEKYGSHIIMDDGMQNPTVKPDMTILVVNGVTGFGNGRVVPAGPMRETLAEAQKRISAVVLVGERDMKNVTRAIHEPLFRAKLKLVIPTGFPRNESFVAFAGIGHPKRFYEVCRRAGIKLVGTKDFADHHAFSEKELEALFAKAAAAGAHLLTTEKDWVRLPPTLRERVLTIPVNLVFDYPAAVVRHLERL